MKRTILALLLIFSLLLTSIVSAENEKSAETETDIPVLMSLADYLNRYPDDEISNEDGSVTEVYRGISRDTLQAFLAFLPDNESKRASNTRGTVAYNTDQQSSTSISGTIDFMSYGRFGSIKNARPVISFIYYTETEEMHITYPKGICDGRTANAKEQYNNIVAMMDAGNIDGAVQAFRSISDPMKYSPVVEYLANHKDLATAISKYRFEVKGEYVTFGRYEQDNDKENGPEPVEWLVLDVHDGKSLLVSRYALDKVPYNSEFRDVTWESSSIRAWLNNDFFSVVFNASEQSAVLNAEIDNSISQGNSDFETDGGINTRDQVFLLSYYETTTYFAEDGTRKCTPTAYAVSREVWISPQDGSCGWWLRSPGSLPSCAIRISSDGSFRSGFVDYNEPAVRPAIWIDLSSEYFTSN